MNDNIFPNCELFQLDLCSIIRSDLHAVLTPIDKGVDNEQITSDKEAEDALNFRNEFHADAQVIVSNRFGRVLIHYPGEANTLMAADSVAMTCYLQNIAEQSNEIPIRGSPLPTSPDDLFHRTLSIKVRIPSISLHYFTRFHC